jgi:hypothetical protein
MIIRQSRITAPDVDTAVDAIYTLFPDAERVSIWPVGFLAGLPWWEYSIILPDK